MCGICGYIGDNKIETETFATMNDTMYHRGPDDGGLWEYDGGEYVVGLAHRRLSILDLSSMGHQPMEFADSNIIVSYNGEIYNYLDIRNQLIELGYLFKSECDTEIIPAAYNEWGSECFNRFNGMYAVAIFDKTRDELILARDKMGKKPLYYYNHNAQFAFGSELKPIIKYPSFVKAIDSESVGEYLCNKCIRAPRTIFRNTYKLEPGSYLIYDCKKRSIVEKKRYWNLVDFYSHTERRKITVNEAKDELTILLRDSIQKRLIADVPVGCFLSSGIDSTLVTAIAKDIKGNIDSFTIGFDERERNEANEARVIAKYIGTNHHELYMSEDEIIGQVRNLIRYYDEPFSDSSQLPCMLVSKIAKKDITVALSGDGGDELCCGYKMYDLNRIVQSLDMIGNIEYHMPWNNRLCKIMPSYVRAFINNRDSRYKVQLFTDVFSEEVVNILRDKTLVGIKNDDETMINSCNYQEKRMILDMIDYLPNDILTKIDRASMKYSLEVRNPLLDYRVVEWFASVDHSLKYHNGIKKYLLKQLAYDYVPKELFNTTKKGFGVPLRKWLRTTLRCEINKVSEKKVIEHQGIFDYEGIQELIRKQALSENRVYAHVLWGIYVFQMWYNEYIETII